MTQETIKINLSCSARKQVTATNNLRNPHRHIVGHHRKLIGVSAVGTSHHEIAAFRVHWKAFLPEQHIVDFNIHIPHPQPYGASDKFFGRG